MRVPFRWIEHETGGYKHKDLISARFTQPEQQERCNSDTLFATYPQVGAWGKEKASESGAWLKFAVIDPTGYPRHLIQRARQKEWPHTLLEPCGRMLRFG